MSEVKQAENSKKAMHPVSRAWMQIAGWGLFILGAVGIVLPLLPTTIFWIGAVWCWSRSAPHLTKRILAHPRFGQPVYLFITYGEISRMGKWMAVLGMSLGFAIFQLVGGPGWQLSLAVLLLLTLVAIWLWQRPEPTLSRQG
ncbi:MAG: YbaN family protein [Candidatus Thiodiazotropha lotti]|uniref:YbaN family protein n=1 Tax=Candidatus Thiodiazotropha endoloripes TaxID=1818881 RepID=UPI0009F4B2DB|nr:YbaN family protein [Candidatus Thiodiazotropha endoloripes]MCG7991599.1 YbaN family protein [Candidatus Thiodiazotropha lotti]MCG7999623.1 YbaN family protein [Candidatus Thiodiazotropha lotti]MCW4183254.1 YbaN family protein [Candidatus Thiodiazotropha weberae]MCW4191391.1 YbaN family protein [Candidatus Thiodiazotropha weberae]